MGEVKFLIFLRMNYINRYNNEMEGVDIADKLKDYYRIYVLVRNRKWWSYISFRMFVSYS